MKITVEQISKEEKVMIPFKVVIIFETEKEVINEIKIIDLISEAEKFDDIGYPSIILDEFVNILKKELRQQNIIQGFNKSQYTKKELKSKN